MRMLVVVTLLMLLSLTAMAQESDGIWVQCRVLQGKLNRLYFDVGEESRVFAGHRAVVIKKKDTVWSGVIAQAYEGVSISEEISKLPEIKSVTAFVQAAPVDSHAVIRVGTTLSPSLIAMMHSGALDSLQQVTGGLVDSVIVTAYDDAQSMEIDFRSGSLDGILTYRADGLDESETRIESAWAPYIAAIVPNGSSALNRRRLLTSSLMYRFDTVIAKGQFDGSEIRFESRLVGDSSGSGWFAYDPETGRRMLRQAVDRETAVRIFAPDSELRKIAGYLADLLARDQFTSILTKTREDCDLSLAFIPANRQYPEATFGAMLDLLGPDSSAVIELSSSISEALTQLRNAGEAVDSVQRRRALLATELVLIADLNCYPLFRPRVYFVSRKLIRGSVFNASGEIDPVGLMRVRPINGGEQ